MDKMKVNKIITVKCEGELSHGQVEEILIRHYRAAMSLEESTPVHVAFRVTNHGELDKVEITHEYDILEELKVAL